MYILYITVYICIYIYLYMYTHMYIYIYDLYRVVTLFADLFALILILISRDLFQADLEEGRTWRQLIPSFAAPMEFSTSWTGQLQQRSLEIL